MPPPAAASLAEARLPHARSNAAMHRPSGSGERELEQTHPFMLSNRSIAPRPSLAPEGHREGSQFDNKQQRQLTLELTSNLAAHQQLQGGSSVPTVPQSSCTSQAGTCAQSGELSQVTAHAPPTNSHAESALCQQPVAAAGYARPASSQVVRALKRHLRPLAPLGGSSEVLGGKPPLPSRPCKPPTSSLPLLSLPLLSLGSDGALSCVTTAQAQALDSHNISTSPCSSAVLLARSAAQTKAVTQSVFTGITSIAGLAPPIKVGSHPSKTLFAERIAAPVMHAPLCLMLLLLWTGVCFAFLYFFLFPCLHLCPNTFLAFRRWRIRRADRSRRSARARSIRCHSSSSSSHWLTHCWQRCAAGGKAERAKQASSHPTSCLTKCCRHWRTNSHSPS